MSRKGGKRTSSKAQTNTLTNYFPTKSKVPQHPPPRKKPKALEATITPAQPSTPSVRLVSADSSTSNNAPLANVPLSALQPRTLLDATNNSNASLSNAPLPSLPPRALLGMHVDSETETDAKDQDPEDLDPEGQDADGHIVIPEPLRDIFSTSAATEASIVREIAAPHALDMWTKAISKGYVLPLDNVSLFELGIISKDCGKHKLIYAVLCEQTFRLLKIGYTTDLAQRKLFYEECKGKMFIAICHLHRLDDVTESFFQQHYRQYMHQIKTTPGVPADLVKVHTMIDERGGEELGVKAVIIGKLLEFGGQLCNRLPAPFELGMCQIGKDMERRAQVDTLANALFTPLAEFLDLSKPVHVSFTAGWPSGFYRPANNNPNKKMFNTSVVMEYITGMPVHDLTDHDLIPVPAVPNSTNATEGFSTDYKNKPKVVEMGRDRIDNFLRHLKQNSLMVVNTADIVFYNKPYDMRKFLENSHMFRVQVDGWNGEVFLMFHQKHKKAILLIRPPGFLADSRREVPLWKSCRRSLTMEAVKQVVHRVVPAADMALTEF